MASDAAIFVRIDSNVKKDAETILRQLGVTPSSLITMLYHPSCSACSMLPTHSHRKQPGHTSPWRGTRSQASVMWAARVLLTSYFPTVTKLLNRQIISTCFIN